MANRYPQALREQIVLEFHQGRSIRALADDDEPCEATIRQWIERETVDDSEREIAAYINGYYNCDRLHSSIGYRTPCDAERAYKLERVNL